MKILLFVVTLVLSLFVISCETPSKENKGEKPISVKVISVTETEISIPVRSSGILHSKNEMKLAFKTGGVIQNIFANEGDAVKKGQLLARLDLAEIKARMDQAESAYQKAERDLQRAAKLHEDSVATFEQLQNAQTGFEVARANRRIAAFNLKHSTIYAPGEGRILKRLFEEKELISPGAPVFLFGNTGEGWVIKTAIADHEVLRLQLNDPAQIYFDAYPGSRFPARITEIAAAANPANGLYEVEITIDAQNKHLLSGFIGKADIIPAKTRKVILVPAQAFMEGEGLSGYVYIINKDGLHSKKIEVTVANILDGQIAVVSGLKEGQRVITDGAAYLTKNSLVTIVNE